MDDGERGQVTRTAAQIYDEFFVPALFGRWSERVADAADIREGQRVLDVACGTGVLARTLEGRVGTTGEVCAVDINEGMLDIARTKSTRIDWQCSAAESLPFDSASFDHVTSQFGLMFFEDRSRALREMERVLRPGGRMAVAVWGRLDDSPGYATMYALLNRLFGDTIAGALHAPFALGDLDEFRNELAKSGITQWDITTTNGQVCFPTLNAWLQTEIRGWTLANVVSDEEFSRFEREAVTELSKFCHADGSVEFPVCAHIGVARKPIETAGVVS